MKAENFFEDSVVSKDYYIFHLDELRKEFGINKIIPTEFEVECLVALSFYPELKSCAIEFRYCSLKSTMASKPKLSFLFKKASNRKYVILIQKPGSQKTLLEISELDFNSLVGWIGHELGHIVHYSHKSCIGLVFTGIKYLFPGYHRRMERFTDEITIQHNLGFALYKGADYALNHSHITAAYKKRLGKFYLQPAEIMEKIGSRQKIIIHFQRTKITTI